MKNEKEKIYRVNNYIKFSPVIVIDQEGKNLGPIHLQKAKDLAFMAKLDLVEISPNSRPPVCRIMDFGKFKFDQTIKEKKQRKKQKKSQVKEIRLSPSIQKNDIDTKIKSAIKFLNSSQKVNLRLEFKRRELAHKDIGIKVFNEFLENIKQYGKISKSPTLDDRVLFCLIEPKESEPNQ